MGIILSCCRSGNTLSVIIVAIAIGFGSHSVAQNSDLGSGTDSSASATWQGNERLNFQADLFTGRFAYSVPIVVAPARQGAEPALALSYNSAGGNGWCGVGWSLEAGFIQRELAVRTGLRDCRTHPKTWDTLRLTRCPAVRVEVGYLTNPDDRARLADAAFRDVLAEGILVAVKRLYLLGEGDQPTGTFTFADVLRRELAKAE